jgi:hypothetical protein
LLGNLLALLLSKRDVVLLNYVVLVGKDKLKRQLVVVEVVHQVPKILLFFPAQELQGKLLALTLQRRVFVQTDRFYLFEEGLCGEEVKRLVVESLLPTCRLSLSNCHTKLRHVNLLAAESATRNEPQLVALVSLGALDSFLQLRC